ncbi:LOW QUALITY PROTEIN: hypothetical protein MKX08_003420 [Trichoderma sp. CBMAI-0020]|nr:LOW QUALITY PROTEIN: hypothetical protein MKX08_003420 [Trichoderma sp. CBMAI-0020]
MAMRPSSAEVAHGYGSSLVRHRWFEELYEPSTRLEERPKSVKRKFVADPQARRQWPRRRLVLEGEDEVSRLPVSVEKAPDVMFCHHGTGCIANAAWHRDIDDFASANVEVRPRTRLWENDAWCDIGKEDWPLPINFGLSAGYFLNGMSLEEESNPLLARAIKIGDVNLVRGLLGNEANANVGYHGLHTDLMIKHIIFGSAFSLVHL